MMNSNPAYPSHQHHAQSTCEHCQGVFEHESWCASKEPRVAYAFEIAANGSKITLGDALILRSLGVTWPGCTHALILAAKR